MYEYLLDTMSANGFQHYEISNFALPDRQSLHNSGYWHGVPYLGIGAGAHSFDGKTRQCNADNLSEYIHSRESWQFPVEQESLTPAEQYNEYVFTALRTSEGLDLLTLAKRFGRILYDVEEHLPELVRVGVHVRQVLCKRIGYRYIAADDMRGKRLDVLYEEFWRRP